MNILYGQKKGMTEIISGNNLVPVTILKLANMKIIRKKTVDVDGYNAFVVEVSGLDKRGKFSFELKNIDSVFDKYNIGDKIHSSLSDEIINSISQISGISKGKGFQGVIKKFHFQGGPKTHGQSDRHRAGGSIGSGTTPGRVYKGKKMPGRMGNQKITIKNISILKYLKSKNYILVSGNVPGGYNNIIRLS